jgi:hypothetical protein
MPVDRDRMLRSGPPVATFGGTTPTVSGEVDRELDQQAGIVTAASVVVSEHAGAAAEHAALPGVLDEGIEQLCRRISAAPLAASPRELCDAAVDTPLDRRDDVALIAVRFG